MMRITFGLINYFNFSILNCLLQYALLKVLSVPLKCLLLLESYRKNSTKCPDSPFALMEVKSTLKYARTESALFQKRFFFTREKQAVFRVCLIKGDLAGGERGFTELELPTFVKMCVRDYHISLILCLFSRHLTVMLLMLSKSVTLWSNSSS